MWASAKGKNLVSMWGSTGRHGLTSLLQSFVKKPVRSGVLTQRTKNLKKEGCLHEKWFLVWAILARERRQKEISLSMCSSVFPFPPFTLVSLLFPVIDCFSPKNNTNLTHILAHSLPENRVILLFTISGRNLKGVIFFFSFMSPTWLFVSSATQKTWIK